MHESDANETEVQRAARQAALKAARQEEADAFRRIEAVPNPRASQSAHLSLLALDRLVATYRTDNRTVVAALHEVDEGVLRDLAHAAITALDSTRWRYPRSGDEPLADALAQLATDIEGRRR